MAEISQRIRIELNKLKRFERLHKEIGKKFILADNSKLYSFDILAIAALNRSMANLAGFISMLRSKNLICAGVILRTQLDTALRLHAAFIVDNPHELADKVLAGEHIRRMKDKNGSLLTDAFLVQDLGREYEWIPRVYERTSGYVHLSGVHMMSTASLNHERERTVVFKMSSTDKELPDDLYIEAITAYAESTHIVLRYLHGWGWTKEMRPKFNDIEWQMLKERGLQD